MKGSDFMNENKTNINWYPGHMAKTKRLISENINLILNGLMDMFNNVTLKEINIDNVYLYQYSSFMNNDLEGLFKYKNITLEDTTHRKSYIELLTLASEAKNDTTAYIDYLKLGLNYYPENPFFFTRLNDYYTQQGLYHTSLLMADSLLISDCSNVLYLEAKNLALLNLKMYEEAIFIFRSCDMFHSFRCI